MFTLEDHKKLVNIADTLINNYFITSLPHLPKQWIQDTLKIGCSFMRMIIPSPLSIRAQTIHDIKFI